MDFESIRVLRGPNFWSNVTLIEAVLEVKPELLDSLLTNAPRALSELPSDTAERVRRHLSDVERSTMTAARLVAELALAFEKAAGCPVEFAEIRKTSRANVYRILVEYEEEQIGRQALSLALFAVHAPIENGLL